MSFIDVAIPAIVGLVLLLWPESVILGSRAAPDAKKIRLLRGIGGVLVVVAIAYLVIRLAGA